MKAILICNGDVPSKQFLRKIVRNYHVIACADGGANIAYRFGIQPDFIIGDLDSVNESVINFFQRKGTEIIYNSDQNSTDIEKSVKFLIHKGCRSIDIVSAIGDRIDHNLGNLSVLVNYHKKVSLRMVDERSEIFFSTGKVSFKANVGDIISLIPLGRKVFVLKTVGLKFKLKNENLTFSGRGVSNIAIGSKVTIHIGKGGVFVFKITSRRL
ncbi:MAG: thiamine diphosphokinase [Candidatus Kryptonium sp.]